MRNIPQIRHLAIKANHFALSLLTFVESMNCSDLDHAYMPSKPTRQHEAEDSPPTCEQKAVCMQNS